MRNIRLVFTLIIVFTLTSGFGYAAVYFELNLYGYGNMAFNLASSNNNLFALTNSPYIPRNSEAISIGGFSGEGGAFSQIGVFIDYPSEFSGFSIMAEFGVQFETMKYTTSVIELNGKPIRNVNYEVATSFGTFNLGAGGKVHFFENISIGVFLGIKFIVSPETVSRISSDGLINESFTRSTKDIIYPYAKISAEYSIVVNNNLAIPLGVFFGFDGAQYLTDDVENRTFSLDLGFMVGMRYRYRSTK